MLANTIESTPPEREIAKVLQLALQQNDLIVLTNRFSELYSVSWILLLLSGIISRILFTFEVDSKTSVF